MNVRNFFFCIQCVLASALFATPASAAPYYFGDTVWQAPGSCTGNVYTNHLCFPNDASPARTAAERAIIQPYLARGIPASDLLFVGNRQPTIEVEIVITNWSNFTTGSDNARFANRTDSELNLMVDGSLLHFGIDTTKLAHGTIVVALFADGSKAVFQLVITPTSWFTQAKRAWQWTGQAWNAEGFEIDRSGNMRFPINGPPTYEPGMGRGAERRIGSRRSSGAGSMLTSSGYWEYWTQTITVSGGGSSSRTFVRYVRH